MCRDRATRCQTVRAACCVAKSTRRRCGTTACTTCRPAKRREACTSAARGYVRGARRMFMNALCLQLGLAGMLEQVWRYTLVSGVLDELLAGPANEVLRHHCRRFCGQPTSAKSLGVPLDQRVAVL